MSDDQLGAALDSLARIHRKDVIRNRCLTCEPVNGPKSWPCGTSRLIADARAALAASRGTRGTICKCGLAKSYHFGRVNLADHPYDPRYPEPSRTAADSKAWHGAALTNLREKIEALEEDEHRPTDPSDEDWQGGWDSALYAVFHLIDSA